MSYRRYSGKGGLQLTRIGLPFFAIVLGSAYLLKHFQQVRFDFRKVRKEQDTYKEFKESLAKDGIQIKQSPVTIDEVYDEVSKIDTEHWENIRGPRPEESNEEYLKAKAKQQAEAKEKKEKRRAEIRQLMDKALENPGNVSPPEPQPNPLPNLEQVEQNDIPVEPGASDPQEPVPAASQPPAPPSEINQPSNSSGPHPNDPSLQELEVDSQKLAELLELGFDEFISELALKRTKGRCLDATIDWIVDHSNQSDLEDSGDSGEDSDGDDEGVSGVVEKKSAEGSAKITEEQLKQAMGGVLSGQPDAPGTSAMARQDLVNLMKALRPARTHKMVFVANMSLKMGAGKLAAQVGHATLGVYKYAQRTEEGKAALNAWQSHGAVKVVVKGQSTEQLIDMFKQAKDLGVYSYLVQDAGYTQIPPGSRTILGLFGPVEDVDKISGALKLL
ncbi:unnamed protein product [Bursaphelenchus xylophilus]|uniref:peptidyl-tRNA hydrolase n=1 Tax=Bursaphelenchus xylophilus TaxID=6326 RepID=A0A1I7RTA0_BURXY|nr:unnamed protein product [Bursaphelenchus xylophilus]CAG9122525.1 unnamed protein product [Bursaphelenchus xylophilus]